MVLVLLLQAVSWCLDTAAAPLRMGTWEQCRQEAEGGTCSAPVVVTESLKVCFRSSYSFFMTVHEQRCVDWLQFLGLADTHDF